MTLYVDIRGALQSRLAATSGIPSIAYEGIEFTPVVGTPWCEAIFVPAGNGGPSTTGQLIRHEGSFEVSLVYPTGNGTGLAEAMADAVKARFKVTDLAMVGSTTVRFRYAERRQALIDTDWIRIPISIGWYLYSDTY